MNYQTFSELVKDMPAEWWDVNGATNGNITGDNATKMASFYSYWSNYLEPTPAFLSYLMMIPGGIAKALYQITASLEHVFNNMFKLFGLFGYLGNQNTIIGQFYYWFQLIGVTLFTLTLVVSAITGVFTKPVKYKNVITNFLLVTLVTSILPMGLNTISAALAEDAMTVQTVGNGNKDYSSLSIQPMKNNVVDLKVLIDNDFNTELFPMDNYGFIKPVQAGSTAVNNITDSIDQRDSPNFASRIDFSAKYGASNEDQLDSWEDKIKGIKGLFLHKLNSNQDGVETITTHRVVDGLNAFENVYLRYKVNWIGMYMQYLVLIVLLISMSIKFVKSVFDIVVEAVISPIQGYSSLSSSKYKELLRTIGGALAGIFFEVVIMRITLEIFRDLPTLSVSTITKLSGGFFDGLNMWEQCLAATIVYIGVFFAAMQGVSMIERWLGVSTGHNETAQQLIGAMMMGNAFAQGAGGVLNFAGAAAHTAGNLAQKAPGFAKNKSRHIADSLAKTGGGLRGGINAVKDQGAKNTIKGGLSNMVDVAEVMAKQGIEGAKNYAGGVMDRMDGKALQGQEAVYKALKNNEMEQQARPSSMFNPKSEPTLDPSGMAGGEVFPDQSGNLGGGFDPGISGLESDIPPLPTEGGPNIEPIDPGAAPVSSVGGEPPAIEPRITLTRGHVTPPSQESSQSTVPPVAPRRESGQPPKVSPRSFPAVGGGQSRQQFQRSLQQMNQMGQQMQQASQRMQQQSHIKGAEGEEQDE